MFGQVIPYLFMHDVYLQGRSHYSILITKSKKKKIVCRPLFSIYKVNDKIVRNLHLFSNTICMDLK